MDKLTTGQIVSDIRYSYCNCDDSVDEDKMTVDCTKCFMAYIERVEARGFAKGIKVAHDKMCTCSDGIKASGCDCRASEILDFKRE